MRNGLPVIPANADSPSQTQILGQAQSQILVQAKASRSQILISPVPKKMLTCPRFWIHRSQILGQRVVKKEKKKRERSKRESLSPPPLTESHQETCKPFLTLRSGTTGRKSKSTRLPMTAFTSKSVTSPSPNSQPCSNSCASARQSYHAASSAPLAAQPRIISNASAEMSN